MHTLTKFSGLDNFDSGFCAQSNLGDLSIAGVLHEAWKTPCPISCVSLWRTPLGDVRRAQAPCCEAKEHSWPQTVIWHSLQVEAVTRVVSTWKRCASLPSGGGTISRRCPLSRFPPRFVFYSSHLERVRGECSVVDVHGSSAARPEPR